MSELSFRTVVLIFIMFLGVLAMIEGLSKNMTLNPTNVFIFFITMLILIYVSYKKDNISEKGEK